MEKITADEVEFESDVDYTTVLDNFEGPLDLLLYLIDREKIEIRDIFVSQVTEQFLCYMRGLSESDMDIDKASEYLRIAATIISIKAKSLLPPPDDEFEDYYGEDEDPQEELIRELEVRRMLIEESGKLKERETVGYVYRQPDKDLANVQVSYRDLNLDGLLKAFTQLMLKREVMKSNRPNVREIPKDRFTVKEKIQKIREELKERESIAFDELFDEDAEKPEIVTTFQALLELLKHQILTVEQEGIFATIQIRKNPNVNEDEDIGELDEYN